MIVPASGDHASMFEGVAKHLKKKVYKGNARVLRATVETGKGGHVVVTFATTRGARFSWDEVKNLKSVITISHGGPNDGPNMNAGSGEESSQPWGRATLDGGSGFSNNAIQFWKLIAGELKPTGKIILVGCSMGTDTYAADVAMLTRRRVYASDGLFAAANVDTTAAHVRAIENGHVTRPMKLFRP